MVKKIELSSRRANTSVTERENSTREKHLRMLTASLAPGLRGNRKLDTVILRGICIALSGVIMVIAYMIMERRR